MVGHLELVELDGSSTVRSVDGVDCASILAALAFVASLGLENREPSCAGAGVACCGEASTSASSGPEPTPPIRGSAGLGLDLLALGMRSSVIAPLVFGEVSVESPRLFAPLLRVALARGTGSAVAFPGGTAAFTWFFGRVEVCPVRIGSRVVAARPCLSVDAGALSAALEGVGDPTRGRVWLAANLAARVDWWLLRWLRVDAEAALGVPVLRDTFVVQAGADVYEPPRIFPSAELSLAAVFP